ncbi:MAG: SDR family oxidoreductase [Phycisphaerae bacterium]|jgi:NAD(P)-dependent dehydrogenase (short-subunit alcohol dehydrogenase family)|nr:SDR family oxidoreductase [Phycisphaerae bacterium]
MSSGRNQLKGQTAIVTGAGRGIGRGIATTLAACGMNVALVARTEEQLRSVQSEIQSAGGTAEVFPTDITSDSEISSLLTGVVERFGGFDILVNNAGMVKVQSVVDTSAEDWDQTMAVNLLAPFVLCRQAIAYLKGRPKPHIINITSALAVKGYAGHCAYTTSKHALLGMTRTLAKEVSDLGILVHAVHPGGVDTGMRFDEDRSILMTPQPIADTVVFLLTIEDSGTVDEIRVRRTAGPPWV